jgi:peptidoglycan/LPS O-acetylase OafA/YrhL
MTPGMDRIRGFDGLRAFALLLVFLQHYTVIGAKYATGGYGVWLFFCLSGFLIVRILVAERKRIEAAAQTVGGGLRRFFWRRTLRIFPPYYLVLVVFTLLAAFHLVGDWTAKAAPWHYAYLSNIYFGFVEGRWVGRFGHFWSLAVEEQFYLLAAPVLLLAPSRWAKGICGATILAALCNDVMLRADGASDMIVYVHPLTNFGALAFGGLIGLSLPARGGKGRASWPGGVAILAMPVFLYLFTKLPPFLPDVARLVSAGPFWAATLLSCAALAGVYLNQESRLVRLLEWGPIAYFGKVSYGFYLYHNVIPRHLLRWLFKLAHVPIQTSEPVEIVFSFFVALGVAALSWKLIEQPLLRLKDRPPRLGLVFARLKPSAPLRAEG